MAETKFISSFCEIKSLQVKVGRFTAVLHKLYIVAYIKQNFFFLFLQAAIGGLALDAAIKLGNAEMIEWGTSVLTTAVLSIIITAPIGALAIAISGPLLLNRIDPKTGQLVSKDNENPEEASMLNKESTEPTEET